MASCVERCRTHSELCLCALFYLWVHHVISSGIRLVLVKLELHSQSGNFPMIIGDIIERGETGVYKCFLSTQEFTLLLFDDVALDKMA